MKTIRTILWLFVAALIGACGGGGGSAGSGSGTPQDLFTSAPDALTLAVSSSESFVVSGGRSPYFVSTDNKAVAVAGISGSTLTIGGVAVGSANIKIVDSAATEKTIALTVGSGTPSAALFTTAPATITLAPGTRSPSYEVRGGAAPYFVSSGNLSVVSVEQTGNAFVLSGVASGPATVINIVDSVGTSKTVTVTVSSIASSPLVVTPNAPAGLVGDVVTLLLSGGSGNYVAASSANTNVATVALAGNAASVTLRNVGLTQVSVRDSLGAIATATVNVTGPANPALRLSATQVSISESITTEIPLSIFGGTAPYFSFVDRPLLAGARVDGSTLYFGLGTNGNRCVAADTPVVVTVIDSVGASAESTVTIVDVGDDTASKCNSLPPAASVGSTVSLALPGTNTRDFSVSGGTAPYVVTSSNPAVVTVAPLVAPNYRLTPVAIGTTTVTVRDAAGAQFTINVAVSSESPLVTTADPSVTVAAGHGETFAISGGTAPYAVVSSAPGISTVFLSGSNMTITGVAAGIANITVTDSVGSPARVVAVTVVPALATTAGASGTVLAVAGLNSVSTYTISGGQPAYSVTSSDPGIVEASVSGITLTIRSVAAGSANVTVRDNAASFGPDVVYTVNVTP